MDDENKQPTPEELAAEQAETQVPKEEEVRAKIIEEYGFDEEADKDRIDKLVTKDIESRKKLSDAIGQKIKHRTAANNLRATLPKPKEETTVVVTPKPKTDLSPMDIIALGKADLPEEDIDEVQEYAAFKKISVTAALKDPVMSGILTNKAEVRRTAEATQTTRQHRGSQAPSGEDLLRGQETGTGEVIETTEGMQDLFKARTARKIRKH